MRTLHHHRRRPSALLDGAYTSNQKCAYYTPDFTFKSLAYLYFVMPQYCHFVGCFVYLKSKLQCFVIAKQQFKSVELKLISLRRQRLRNRTEILSVTFLINCFSFVCWTL